MRFTTQIKTPLLEELIAHLKKSDVDSIAIDCEEPAVREWLKAHPEALVEGQKKLLGDEISRVQSAIRKLEQEVKRERVKLRNLKQQRERL